MASVYFYDLPGDWKEFKSEGTDVKVSAGLQGTLDSHGTLDAGAVYQKFTLVLPIGDGGDLPGLRLANLSLTPQWKNLRGQEKEWAKGKFLLDKLGGGTISYDVERILVDEWDLQPLSDGASFAEVLQIRVFKVERRRNGQNQLKFESTL